MVSPSMLLNTQHQPQIQMPWMIGNESGVNAVFPKCSWNMLENNPLQEQYQLAPLPENFNPPEITKYTGSTDPESHLRTYTAYMMIYSSEDMIDKILCRCFPITLAGHALDWFSWLPPRSIGSFSQLGEMFIQRFEGSRIPKKHKLHLLNIRQRTGEQLAAYLKRFNEETFHCYDSSEEMYIYAFCNGLLPGRYSKKLYVLQPQTKKQLFEKVFKWIQAEDLEKSKREVRQLEREESLRTDNMGNRFQPFQQAPSPYEDSFQYTLLDANRALILQELPSATSGETSSGYISKKRLREETLWNGSGGSCTLEFDGASKGNPGQAGAGVVMRANDGSLICRLREGLGIATCNAAEYRAIILRLKYALDKGFTSIRVFGDSKLVCMQIRGIWKVKNRKISILYEEAKNLKDRFLSFQIIHVLRDLNSEADEQANLATELPYGQIQEESV